MNEKGFTLVETVVSLVLLGLLMSGLYTLFSGSLHAWRKAESIAEQSQHVRMVSRFLLHDLENLVSGKDAVLTGQGPEEGEESGGVLYLATAPSETSDGSVVEVMYSVRPDGLFRQEVPPALLRRDEGQLEEEEPNESELLSALVCRLQPEVLVDGEWQPEFETEGSSLPSVVRVRFWIGQGEDETAWEEHRITVAPRITAALGGDVPVE